MKKQMMLTTSRITIHTPPATGTIQVQQRSAVMIETSTVVIVIFNACLMWKARYGELTELLASKATITPTRPVK